MTAPVEVRVKHRYSYDHLKSAIFFAKNARELEQKYENTFESLPPDKQTTIREEYSAFVTSATILSVAFIEGHINEFFDNISGKKSESQSSGPIINKLYEDYSENFKIIQSIFYYKEDIYDRLSLLKKYDFALACFNKEPFEKGKNPYQDINLIIKLRNSLVHYYPEYHPAQIEGMEDEQHQIEKQLQKKFALNPFYENTGNPFFPYKCLSYGSAKWAIKTSYKFVNKFYSKFDLESEYDDIIKTLDVKK